MLTFARTKIQPPRPRQGALVLRPVLQRQLVGALNTLPLVLVSAAAGFGKTSALAQSIELLPPGTAVAWVSCDHGDSPLQLFSCLVAALEPCDPPWRTSPEALIAAAAAAEDTPAGRAASQRAMVSELINALDACEVSHGVIMVDDLHRIEHRGVYEFIDRLLERMTPRWTLAIASREVPPIALARLRAAGEVAEFTLDALRFGADETRALAASVGLDADAAQALHQRTAGWPAGLRLALNVMRSMPGASLEGSAPLIDRHVFEFLATEVLGRLAPELRDFLLRTSVLPELSAARCAALSGDARAGERLEAIERAGLFASSVLSDGDPTLRLHDLFRDALEHRLQLERPAELPRLLERAARTEPDGVRRLGYWLRAEAWDEAARELHLQTYSLLTASQTATVERWLQRFPTRLHHEQPDLLIVRTLVSWMHWRWRDMIAAAQAAAERFEQAGRPLDAMAARAYGVLALRGGGQRADSDALAQRLNRELEALLAERAPDMRAGRRWEEHEPGLLAAMLGCESVVWAAFDDARLDDLAAPTARSIELLDHAEGLTPFFQMLPLPAYVGLRGMQPVLQRYVSKARERLTRDDTHLGTLVQALDGSLRLWAGDAAGGRLLLREAAAEVRWHDFPLRVTDHVYPFLCIADVLLGDTAALVDDAAVLEQILRRATELPDIGRRVASELFFTGRWLFAGGQTASALRLWRLVEGWDDPRTRPLWRTQMAALPAFIALAEGRLADAAQGIAAALDAHDRELDLQGQWTELRLRGAELRLRLGHAPREAARWLEPLFERHAGDADIAAVWLVGPGLLQVLAATRWNGALTEAQIATLARWADGAAALRSTAPRPATLPAATPAAAEPARDTDLSERELEVLARIAAGDSNKLIARAFDLSPHTVKRHVANILDKLDLRSRGQASAWFHEHHA
ncbi:MAG TPA: LuxR C-terminal-related transcriptional regulator [Burkholderiaceae bacterium]|nr:LuxR C-terminal-related transcriptional regulator [Burkholderiaceae bacterium]